MRRVMIASPNAESAARLSPHLPNPVSAAAIGAAASSALLAELAAWPKPGLVSYLDNGSHRDMDAAMLRASAAALTPYFEELAQAGQTRAPMETLREIGVRAEAAMLSATNGVNTHRGAIFGLGLLAAAAGASHETAPDGRLRAGEHLGKFVARHWGAAIMKGPVPLFSHGSRAWRRYGASGARGEAASGFPSVYEVGLPALRDGRRLGGHTAAAVQACFALIATVTDTNLLHRGGIAGADFAAASAARFLANGGVGHADWQSRAQAVHAEFVARNLSPGGCADLLAMTLFVDALEAGLPAP
jgi:triphosphoribosyl-dephospho-CoA synthase